MRRFRCPRCGQDGISFKDKYYAGLWLTVVCSQCGARLCAQPWFMAVGYMIYFWAIAWFVMWALLEHSWLPILYMLPVWALLDLLNIYFMPLAVLRSRGS